MITALPKTFEYGYQTVHDTPQMALGEYWHSNDLNIHTSYVRFGEDVEIGEAVRSRFSLYSKTNLSPMVSGGSVYAAAGTMQIEEHDAAYLTSLADGLTEHPALPSKPDYRDYAEIAIVGGTGEGQRGIITDFSDKILNILWYSDAAGEKGKYTTGQLTTALAGDSDYVISAPWYVVKCDGPGVVNGVVVAKAKKGQYGLVIWCGTDFVFVGEQVAAGDMLYVDPQNSSAYSAGKGYTPEGTTVANAFSRLNARPYATALYAGDQTSLIRSHIHCTPISVMPELPRQQVRGFEHPRKSITT